MVLNMIKILRSNCFRSIPFYAVVLALGGCISSHGLSLPSSREESQKWQEARSQLASPDPIAMARLEPFVGEWDWDVAVWPFPGAEPQEAKGKAVMDMVAGGRFLKIDYEESVGGSNWGTMFLGFDRGTSLYQLVSFGTTSSAMTVGWGEFDRTTWNWKFDVAFTDPVTRREAQINLTIRRPRLNTQIWTAWRRNTEGEMVRWSETTFTKHAQLETVTSIKK